MSDEPDHLFTVHLAVEMDEREELTRLLDAGADPDEVDEFNGWTPLLRAIEGESDGSVQTGKPLEAATTAILLAYGADPERPSRDGLTPMHLAFQARHEMAVRLLEAHIARRRAQG
ncbi:MULTISPECIES: ankyrin repeat domain-containing protein [unclassified Streptomyces]|uniref:ankyrin repeat domain-containing protein n=1 Tax=unclassified Streptomyces TaxID=2593676 RepID=UPI0037F4903D